MLRLRIAIPLLLSSSLTFPSISESAVGICQPGSSSPRCEAMRARAFAAARNAEIDASIAAVAVARELALARTHCKSAASTTPRCEAERAREFAAARNAESNASIAAVDAERAGRAMATTHCAKGSATPRCEAERARELAQARTHCKSGSSPTPRCEAERARELAAARNARMDSAAACQPYNWLTASCEVTGSKEFAAARNAEINASIARVKAAREFAAARNAEINASVARVEARRARSFAAARNAEINASIARVNGERARSFAAARNAEINASIAAVRAERDRAFAAARNAETRAVLAAYERQRAQRLAQATSSMETSAINRHDTSDAPRSGPRTRQAMNATPCRAASRPLNALQFSGVNAVLDTGMMRELDSIAAVVKMCPAVRIEIHGHANDWTSAEVNQRLADARAQAAMAYLMASGVPANRMAAIGHAGGADPGQDAATTDVAKTAIVRGAANRRVEFKLRDPAHDAAALRVMWDLAELLDPAYVPAVAGLSPLSE